MMTVMMGWLYPVLAALNLSAAPAILAKATPALAILMAALFGLRRQARGDAGWMSALLAPAAALALALTLSPLHLVAALAPGLQGIAHYPTPGQPPGTPRLEFDVVSVKPLGPDEQPGPVQPTPGYQGYTARGEDLRTDMTVAYGVIPRQIQGLPDWATSEGWDIEAKSAQPHSIDELHLMFEHALEDRFQLKLHHETREETVLALKVESGGAKLTAHQPPNDINSPPMGFQRVGADGPPQPGEAMSLELKGSNIAMSYLAFFLTRAQGTPVLDETGLDGHYDIDVKFELMPPPDGGRGAPPDFSPLFDAIRSQLGIRIEKGGKGPVDYLIVDSVQKPTGN